VCLKYQTRGWLAGVRDRERAAGQRRANRNGSLPFTALVVFTAARLRLMAWARGGHGVWCRGCRPASRDGGELAGSWADARKASWTVMPLSRPTTTNSGGLTHIRRQLVTSNKQRATSSKHQTTTRRQLHTHNEHYTTARDAQHSLTTAPATSDRSASTRPLPPSMTMQCWIQCPKRDAQVDGLARQESVTLPSPARVLCRSFTHPRSLRQKATARQRSSHRIASSSLLAAPWHCIVALLMLLVARGPGGPCSIRRRDAAWSPARAGCPTCSLDGR
jgi:hypothetical protein